MFSFFHHRLNRQILFAFFLIIVIPAIASFWANFSTLHTTMRNETVSRLREGASAYFAEFTTIEEENLGIATVYARKPYVVNRLVHGEDALFEKEIVDFYQMNLVDIVEIEDRSGTVIFRGHAPSVAGDIKIDQQVIRDGLAGTAGVTFEHGRSGFAIRAVAPITDGDDVVGLFMVGSRLSKQYVENLKKLTLLDNGIYRGDTKIVATYDGMEMLDDETVARLRSGETVVMRDERLNTGPCSVLLAPILLKGTYWGAVGLGISNDDSEKVIQYSNRQITLIIAVGLSIALVIYLFLARSINTSFVTIVNGISNYSFDRENEEITLARNDVFHMIADQFNTLIHRIDLYNRRIQTLQDDLLKSERLATAGKVATSLAHEIRNPLSSIKMMAQIVATRHLGDGGGREEMDVILEEIDRINGKVRDLLEFARPGRIERVLQDIHPIIESVLKLAEYLIEQNGIDVATDFASDLPELYVDGEKLRICFMNIIMNGIQAMPEGGTLTIATSRSDGEAVVRICSTSNAAQTLSPEEMFEPFVTTKKEGTGLGLAISKLEIERHKGTISISREGTLICFDIRLPIGPALKEV